MRLKNSEDIARIGIIGGTGADIKLENSEDVKVYTPYGMTSDAIKIGTFKGQKVAFLSRHGTGHVIPPHKLNFRANIWALSQLGVKIIISPSAVGSLKKEHDKGKFVLVNQYIDRTKKRLDTFYEGGPVCHISQADPYCSSLNDLFYETGKTIENLDIQKGGTYVCIEGPRFSTRAESITFRQWGGDIIGMTTYPEVVLAAEKEICYCCIATVTDLDVWAGECEKCGIVEFGEVCPSCKGPVKRLSVDVTEIIDTMVKNAEKLKKLLELTIPKIDTERECECHHSLEGALL
ncbi:MAG: S-methyl-5'-thioadenosine phosphorylase [Promethearchaeota archaeon]|nr:MAG: S-methyl-5'-thioadenosine phosphorylase [Candidatus Lokiarchaeota archaeon]